MSFLVNCTVYYFACENETKVSSDTNVSEWYVSYIPVEKQAFTKLALMQTV